MNPDPQPIPNNADVEQAVLSCAIQSRKCLHSLLSSTVGESLFYHPSHKLVWKAVCEVALSDRAVDLITVTDQLRVAADLEKIGGPGKLAEIYDNIPSTAVFGDYFDLAMDYAKRRALILECERVVQDAYNPEAKVNGILQRLDTATRNLLKSDGEARIRPWRDVMLSTLEGIERRYKLGGELPGISTGYSRLDDFTNGYQEGQLWIVGARPGVGKTALGLNLIENLAAAGHESAIFSAEMLGEELAIRSIAAETRINSLSLSRGEIDKAHFPKIMAALNKKGQWNIHVDDRENMGLFDVESGTRELTRGGKVKVVFVDYLQLLQEEFGSRSREDAVRRLSNGLKNLAKALRITVVALAQLSRQSTMRADKKPQLSDLRDSGAIEQDANVVILLNPSQPDSQDLEVEMDVYVAKCRGGMTGNIKFTFDKTTSRFTQGGPNQGAA